MQTTTTNTLQLQTPETIASTRFVRTGGAADAQGFAQIMQAFDSKSELAEAIEQDTDTDTGIDRDEIEHTEHTDQDVNNEKPITQGAESAETNQIDEGDAEPQAPINTDQSSAAEPKPTASPEQTTTLQSPSDSAPTTPEPTEGTKGDEASLRLLENQGEHAKFTIKGLVHSLTHAADANLTDIAVKTRLGGHDTGGEPQAQPKQTPPESAVSSQPKSTTPPIPQDQIQSLKFTPEPGVQIRNPAETWQSDPSVQVPADARVDQASVEAQQVNAQRGDTAGMVAQSGVTTRLVDQTQSKLDANQLAGVNRSPSQQAVRAVSSVESGNVGSQQSDTNTSTLVDKMKATELPSETRRAAVLAQVQRGLASLLRSGKNEMVLKLTPGNLGEVRISIKSDGDRLAIRFETSTQEATDHLNASAKELYINLRGKGISLENIEIEHTPTDDASSSDASKPFDSSSADQSGQHNQQSGRHNTQSKADREPGIEPGDDPIIDQPQPIWTELGLDAIA